MQHSVLEPRVEVPAVGVESRPDWEVLLTAFLADKQSAHTQRSYRAALVDFFQTVGKEPDRVSSSDVALWAAILKQRGNTSRTRAVRMTAVSSFYSWLLRPRDAQGGQGFVRSNPVAGATRPMASGYGTGARKLSLSDFRRLLATTDRGTLSDKRDRCLLFAYALTGRRREELARLRGRDLELQPDGCCLYQYTGKGQKTGKRELPEPVVDALRDYLRADGRDLDQLRPDDPVFRARRGPSAGAALSGDAVAGMLKKRARKAGIDPGRIRAHGLRHLCAELRRDAGDSIEEVSSHLDHSSVAITSVYLRAVLGTRDKSWRGAYALLTGLPAHPSTL